MRVKRLRIQSKKFYTKSHVLELFLLLIFTITFFLVFSAVPVVFSVPVPAPDVVVEPT
jgi:hypothetical protein